MPRVQVVVDPQQRGPRGKEETEPPVPPIAPGVDYPADGVFSSRYKVVAGLLGVLLPGLGLHRFYLGYVGIGVLQLVLVVLTCGISSIWGLVEGIMCFTGHLPDVDGRPLRD